MSITGNSNEGPLTPNIGRRRFIGALRSRGLGIQRWRVSDCLRRVDPVGTALRWGMTIHRRKYFVPTPNSLWHIDSGHKLIRYDWERVEGPSLNKKGGLRFMLSHTWDRALRDVPSQLSHDTCVTQADSTVS